MHFVQARKKINTGLISKAYILFGEDVYSKNKFLGELRLAMEKKYKQTTSLEHIEDLDPSALSWYLNQGSLVAQKRIIVINSPPYQEKGGKGQPKLDDVIISQLQQDKGKELEKVVVFIAEKVDKRKKAVKAIEKIGALVDFNPLQGQALFNFLNDICKEKGIVTEKEAIEELVIRKGEDLHVLTGELEKISLYLEEGDSTGKKLTVDVVKKLASPQQAANIFQLVEAVGKQEVLQALKMLEAMLQQKEPPPLILFMLARHYRLLMQTLATSENKKNAGYLAGKLGVPRRAAASLLEQSNFYTKKSLAKASSLLAETDHQIKKGKRRGDLALELLIWKLSV